MTTSNNNVRVYVRLEDEMSLGSVRSVAKALARKLRKKVRVANSNTGMLYVSNGNRGVTHFKTPTLVPSNGKVTVRRV